MAWHHHAPEIVVRVDCDGHDHTVRWRRGRLRLDDHDAAAEEALAGLGGRRPPCLDLLDLWRAAVRDGGFVEEWASRPRPDAHRQDWLGVALRRLRTEGVQDLLPSLAPARADRMGTVLVSFPPPLQDRAAVAVAARHLRSAPTAGRGLQPSPDHRAAPPGSAAPAPGASPARSAIPPGGAAPPGGASPARSAIPADGGGPPPRARPAGSAVPAQSAGPPGSAAPAHGASPARSAVPAQSAGDAPSGPGAVVGPVNGSLATRGRVRSEPSPDRPTDPRAASAVTALQRHLVEAARARARIAFVGSLLPLAEHARPAALVPLTCEVVNRREPPSISGRLAGRESWCHLRLGADWLVEVWGRGISVIDGHLVVAVIDDRGADLRVTVVRWQPAGGSDGLATSGGRSPAIDDGAPTRPGRGGLVPALVPARLTPTPCAGWALTWH